MAIKIGINGFGRMGRLTFRAAFGSEQLEFVQINDVGGDAHTLAHLLTFDSVQGRWPVPVYADCESIVVDGQSIAYSHEKNIDAVDWSNCDIVLDATGVHKTVASLNRYLAMGVKRVVVSSPVKDPSVLNVVMGVNDHLYQADKKHRIVTAASCTTNCIAPVIKAMKMAFTIDQIAFTTIHDITNTQTILDAPHKDLRRARACGMSLIPTTTGSAKAVVDIFPELNSKIDGHAVRVPLANASMTDIVFNLQETVTAKQVNKVLQAASQSEDLLGVLGYEERPLVSIDYLGDARSSIVDALSTMVINQNMVKVYAWYDNEWGYASRTADLIRKVAAMEP